MPIVSLITAADEFLPGPHLAGTLAAAGSGGPAPTVSIVIWVGILITVLVGGGFLVMLLRRNLLSKDVSGATAGMTLDQLRGMHRRGELSQDEYETARSALTAGLTGRPPPQKNAAGGASSAPSPGALVAPPGFDLTGQPLPAPTGGMARPGTADEQRP